MKVIFANQLKDILNEVKKHCTTKKEVRFIWDLKAASILWHNYILKVEYSKKKMFGKPHFIKFRVYRENLNGNIIIYMNYDPAYNEFYDFLEQKIHRLEQNQYSIKINKYNSKIKYI